MAAEVTVHARVAAARLAAAWMDKKKHPHQNTLLGALKIAADMKAEAAAGASEDEPPEMPEAEGRKSIFSMRSNGSVSAVARVRLQSQARRRGERQMAQNRAAAAEVRQKMDTLCGRDVAAKLFAVRPADEAAQVEASELCNKAVARHFHAAEMPWITLFKLADTDGSGRITYLEWCDMLRKLLHLPRSQLSSAQLKALWRALDRDSCGSIGTTEFAAFMRMGGTLPEIERHKEDLEEMQDRLRRLQETAHEANAKVARRLSLPETMLKKEVTWMQQKCDPPESPVLSPTASATSVRGTCRLRLKRVGGGVSAGACRP